MKLGNLRLAYRLLLEDPAYSCVVIGGLGVGFAIVFLLLGFVIQSTSYDRHVPQNEQVYVVKSQFNYNGPGGEWTQAAPQILKTALDAKGMQVKSSGYLPLTRHMTVNNVPHEVRQILVHPEFAQVMGLSAAKQGDLQAALSRPDGLALTEETARRLYGDTHVVGRTLLAVGQTIQVLAVVADPPVTSTFPYEALAGSNSTMLTEALRATTYTDKTAWGWLNGGMFVRLDPGVAPRDVERALQDAIDASPLVRSSPPEVIAKLGQEKLLKVRLSPLREAYLDPDVSAGMMTDLHGNLRILQALLAVAMLILLLSAANYVNLATVRTLRRQREIAVRKVLGASVPQVIRQFIGESVLAALIACALGIGLAYLFKPMFAHMVNRNLDGMFSPAVVGLAIGIGVLLGILAGAYPSWVALKVRASQALSGRGNSETAAGLAIRRTLTTLQFATAIALCALSLAITWQTRYASGIDPGFDARPLLIVDLPRPMNNPQAVAFRDAVARSPEADGVTGASDAVGRHKAHIVGLMRRDGGDMTSVEFKWVRPDFFDVYRVAAKAGRVFDAKLDEKVTDVVVIDAAASKALGFATPAAALDRTLTDDEAMKFRIVGIASDIRFEPLNKSQEPVVYTIKDTINTMTIRARHDIPALLAEVDALWKQHFPNNVMHATPAQAFFELQYADESRVAHALALAAAIAFLIAAFGVYVLAAYSVRRREREIVLRKLHGANPGDIAKSLLYEFGSLIGVSALLAIPLGWLAIERYLRQYHERAPIGLWPLGLALLFAATVTLISTGRHTFAAMRVSPAQVLRV